MFLLGDDPVLGSRVPVGSRRALAVLAAWAMGIGLVRVLFGGGVVIPAGAWSSGAGLCIAGALVARDRYLGVLLLGACLLLGSGWASWRWFEPPSDSLAVRIGASSLDRVPIEVRAVVTQSPELGKARPGALSSAAGFSQDSWAFTVRTQAVRTASGWEPVSGSLRVFAGEHEPAGVKVGVELELAGLYAPVRGPMNPGSYDARLRAAESGRVGTLSIGVLRLVPHDQPPGVVARVRAGIVGWIRAARERSRSAVLGDRAEPSPARAVVAALVLGERPADSSEVRAAFARQGVAHLLAISGFHLVLVCAAALFVVRSLVGGLVGRWGGQWGGKWGGRWVGRWAMAAEPLAVALVVAGYLVLVPARPPMIRAGMMVLGLLGAELSGRRYHGLGVIAWVGVAMLAWKPSWLFETGFEFSFLMTGALLWLGGRVDAVIARRRLDASPVPPDVFDRQWWWAMVRKPVSAGVVCWMVGVPIIAARFGWLSVLAIVSTVVLLPIVAVVLIAGVLAALFSVVGFDVQASGVLEAVASPAAWYVLAIDRWPWTHVHVPPTPGWLGWTGSALVLGWLGGVQCARRGLQVATGLWVAALAVVWVSPRFAGPEASLDTFAVGNGTCIVLRSKGEALLWDAGSTRPDLGVWELPRAMRASGIGTVRTAMITHANFDHFSALPDLVEPLGLERVLVSQAFLTHRDQPAVDLLLKELNQRGVVVETIGAGSTIALGRCSLEVLSALDASGTGSRGVPVNDESLVAKFSTPSGATVLLTGDIQAGAMRRLGWADVRADVLELPHHGSATPDAVEFLSRVQPAMVLQSTGPSRAGDPRWGGRRSGLSWRTTAVDGWSHVELRGDRLVVRSMHAPSQTIFLSAAR